LDSIKEFLDRINAKYDEEDLSDNIWEIQIPFDDTLMDTPEVKPEYEEKWENNFSEKEYSNLDSTNWEETQAPEENQQ
jgi:hypothetical protein